MKQTKDCFDFGDKRVCTVCSCVKDKCECNFELQDKENLEQLYKVDFLKTTQGGMIMAKVKVYSTQTCPWCFKVKDFLKEKNVEFDDIDVSKDHEAAKAMVEKSGQMGVPQIEINGKIIVGFNVEAINEALGLKE